MVFSFMTHFGEGSHQNQWNGVVRTQQSISYFYEGSRMSSHVSCDKGREDFRFILVLSDMTVQLLQELHLDDTVTLWKEILINVRRRFFQ